MLLTATRLISIFKIRATIEVPTGWEFSWHDADCVDAQRPCGGQLAKNPDLDYLAIQIKNAEAEQARSRLRQIIADIQLDQGRYAYALVKPLTLLGDAQMALQNPAGSGPLRPCTASE